MKIERIDLTDRQDWMIYLSQQEAIRLIELLARQTYHRNNRSIELDHSSGKLLIQVIREPDPPNDSPSIDDIAADMKRLREELEKNQQKEDEP